MPSKTKINEEIAVMANEIANIKEAALESKVQNTAEHLEIKVDIKDVRSGQTRIEDKLDKAIACKADKDELNYWRNVLVSGILITIFVTIVINLLVN
jgi:hypothetical protein